MNVNSMNVTASNSSFECTISIITAAIAMLALCVYPPLQSSINRGKQKRMMADMRSINEAVEAYHVDFNTYPPGKSTVEEIRKHIGLYMDDLPLEDGWGNNYLYWSDGLTSYTIISFGKDRVQDGPLIYHGVVTSFSNDIVFSNGVFISFPPGG